MSVRDPGGQPRRGELTDGRGRPVTDARIVVVRAPGSAPDIAQLSDGDGGFDLPDLGPGDYEIDVFADGYAVERIRFHRPGAPSDAPNPSAEPLHVTLRRL